MYKALLMLIFAITMTNCSMEEVDEVVVKSWAQQAQRVKVNYLEESIELEIDKDSRISDLKSELHILNKAPVAQQQLFPLITNWWRLGLSSYAGKQLDDDEVVKVVMSQNGTDTFLMTLAQAVTISAVNDHDL